MFPSNNSFPFDSNLNSTQQQSLLLPPPPFSFLHFPPPPFEDNNGIFFPHHHDHHLLLHNHHQSQSLLAEEAGIMDILNKPNNEQIPAKNKRICKRDRHSKIKTSKGLRDRRMRLSLEVAKRFFGLQDILGFDKASKTVEWLLNQSKDEIKRLAMDKNYNNNDSNCSGVVKSASSTSECEGVSGLDDVSLSGMNNNQDQQEGGDHHQPSLPVTMTTTKRRSTKNTRKIALMLDPLIARESREKARERARERTKQKQKMKMKSSRKLLAEADDETTNHNCNLTQFGSWNPFETGEKVKNPTLEVNVMPSAAKEDEPNSQANDDDSLAVNMIFNSLNTSSTFLQDHHQFAEFQSLSKFWEAYNNNHMI